MKSFNIGWGLTNLCNMNCQFCYSKQVRNKINECDINDWKKFIDENSESINSINYGTGENSIMDQFFYFVSYVRKNYPHIRQSLTTNGYISERITNNIEFKDIFKNCIDEVDVSVDFYNEKKHSEFRGQPNAYKWALKTLDYCVEYNKLTTIVFVGYEDTLQEENIDGLFSLAKKYNALLRMNIYRPVSKVPEINQRFILSYKTLMSSLKYINSKYEIVALSDALLGNIFTNGDNIKDNTGVNSIRILPDGSICPSTYLIEEKYRQNYNIKESKVLDKINFKEFVEPVIPYECKGCKYENSCRGGVFDRRILWYGTLSQRDPYCPIRMNDEFPKEKFKTSKIGRVSVHDDYLPTLFFKNK